MIEEIFKQKRAVLSAGSLPLIIFPQRRISRSCRDARVWQTEILPYHHRMTENYAIHVIAEKKLT
jgi:hypothetical protein